MQNIHTQSEVERYTSRKIVRRKKKINKIKMQNENIILHFDRHSNFSNNFECSLFLLLLYLRLKAVDD